MSGKVVINASPFILLSKCGLVDLLPQLFSEILMPDSVLNEIEKGNDLASKLIGDFQNSWLRRVPVSIEREIELWNLGDGESEVLSFVLTRKSDYLALIDDRAARRCAETYGIRTIGTAGLLVMAKNKDLIPAVRPELEKLEAAGLYISEDIKAAIYKQANEIE